MIVGGASLVLLISLSLPWFAFSLFGHQAAEAKGITIHRYLWVVFLLALAILAFLVRVARSGRVPFARRPKGRKLLAAVTWLNLLLVLLAFLFKPVIGGQRAVPSGFVVTSWTFGAFIALAASAVAVAAASLGVTAH
jgi:hypothetical protein